MSIRDYPGLVAAVYAFRAVASVVIAADGTAVRAGPTAATARFRTLAESLVGDDAVLYRSPTVAVRPTAAQTPRAATTVPWPLRAAELPKPGGSCLYTGMNAVRVQAAAENAYVEAGWASGPVRTSLYYRPVLPGTTRCD